MASQKISKFNVSTSLNDSDLFTFVINGTNKNVAFSNFKLSLGVTGTLTAIGDPLGVQVLSEPTAQDYQIRAIESGNGIIASVSAQNGIKLNVNFAQGAAGTELIKDLNSAQPLFRSLVAGNGINIASTGDAIQISAVDAVVSTKTVVISVESDFPDAVGGVITLNADTQYLLIQGITTSNRFVLQEKTTVAGSESLIITFTYNGTGDMFTGVDVAGRISCLTIDCPNGRVLNYSTSVPRVFRLNDIQIISCDKIALLNSTGAAGVIRFTNVSPANVITDGIELTGNWNSFLHEISAASINGGAYFNLGTAMFNSVIIDLPLAKLSAGTYLISGAANSANINPNGIGLVTRALTSGAGTPLNIITVNDAMWDFSNNDDIPDTRTDGMLSLSSNVTETVITAVNTPVKVAGTWVVQRESRMTGDTSGRLTYDNGKDSPLPLDGPITALTASGGSKTITLYLGINGAHIPESAATMTISSSVSARASCIWQEVLAMNDFVEIFVENNTDTTNIIVTDAILRVN